MTENEKMLLVESMTQETDQVLIQMYLKLAAESICNYVDPYKRSTPEDIMKRYSGAQVKAAAYFLNKRGAEGELSHSENGIVRTYENADLPESILRELIPICGATK